VDAILDDHGWEPLIGPVIEGLDEELAGAESLEDAKAILERRIEALGVTAFADTLARLSFAARLAGETDEDVS
ncbi:MAG: hypothetical protein ABJH20_03770, partial [Rhizobiaceae bacterium]